MSKGKFSSTKKDIFLENIPSTSLESGKIIEKCKFNFSYFDKNQEHGQDFCDWEHPSLIKLLEKLKNYSEFSLEYWRHQRSGAGSLKIFEIYGKFPGKSEFIHPKHVPHNVSWARFRLENLVRMVGFIVPKDLKLLDDNNNSLNFDHNTFYVVFLDKNHKFYISEDP